MTDEQQAQLLSYLDAKFGKIERDIQGVRDDMARHVERLDGRIDETNARIDGVRAEVGRFHAELYHELIRTKNARDAKVDELEVRVTALEGAEG